MFEGARVRKKNLTIFGYFAMDLLKMVGTDSFPKW